MTPSYVWVALALSVAAFGVSLAAFAMALVSLIGVVPHGQH